MTSQVVNASPGHDVYCQVFKYFTNNQAWAEAWCKDVSTGQVAIGAEYVGNFLVNSTAEWIVERPSVNNVPDNLSNYGTAIMRNAYTETTTGVWFTYSHIYPNWSLYQVIMTNNSNQTLSFASSGGTYNIDWQWRQSF